MSDKGKTKKSGRTDLPDMNTNSYTKNTTANLQKNKRHIDNI